MAFDHNAYQLRYRNHFQQNGQVINDAEGYGVRVVATPPAAGAIQWKAVGVHHLTPDENRSRHNAFVDILDEQGQPLRDPDLRAGWSWEGRRPDEDAPPQPLDKSLNEPAGNVPLFKGAQLEVWISDPDAASDHVVRMSTDHPDEPNPDGEIFNSIGHHSYYVVFQRIRSAGESGGGESGGGESGGGESGGGESGGGESGGGESGGGDSGGGESGGGDSGGGESGGGENVSPTLKATLLAEGELHQVIRFNPDAALQKCIFADGFVPNSPEFPFFFDWVSYIGQRAEHLATGEVRIYHVIVGDWGNVQFVSRPR